MTFTYNVASKVWHEQVLSSVVYEITFQTCQDIVITISFDKQSKLSAVPVQYQLNYRHIRTITHPAKSTASKPSLFVSCVISSLSLSHQGVSQHPPPSHPTVTASCHAVNGPPVPPLTSRVVLYS